MLEQSSARQRAAVAVTLGHKLLALLAVEVDGALALDALADAQRWVDGAAITAQTLTDHLVNEREEGLLLAEQRCTDERRKLAWIAFETAIAYVAWQAWNAQGEWPAALLSEVGEDTLDLLREQADAAGVR